MPPPLTNATNAEPTPDDPGVWERLRILWEWSARGFESPSPLVRMLWRVWMLRFTPAGRAFLWPTLAFAGYAQFSSLEYQDLALPVYAVGFWAVALTAGFVFRPRVRLAAEHSDRVRAGESLPVRLTVEQTGRLPGLDQYVLFHRPPAGLEPELATGVALPPLARGGSAEAVLRLRCARRGSYRLGGYRVQTDFPFGLVNIFRAFPEPRTLTVYPAFERLDGLDIPGGRTLQPGGVALAAVVGESTEFVGNREYRNGDPVRNIDWRASARLGRPIVREYREEYFVRVAVILDTQVARPRRSGGREDFERAVSLAAAVSDYIARQDHLIDLFAAGPKLYHLTAGRSLAYLDQILDILACVDPGPEEPFEQIEPELLENLSQITAVIGIFLDWNPARRELADKLRRQGVGVRVFVVREGPCTLEPMVGGGGRDEVPVTVLSRAEIDAGVRRL